MFLCICLKKVDAITMKRSESALIKSKIAHFNKLIKKVSFKTIAER